MNSWEFMKIKGIPLRVHPSWFLVVFYFTLSAQAKLATVLNGDVSFLTGLLIGLLTSVLLFFSIVLHELGHSFMAIHEGAKVRDITLFFLGGMTSLAKECSTPLGNLRIAISGPIISLAIAISLIVLSNLFTESSFVFSNLLNQVGSLNFLIAIFNLLPVLPLDGGMILKSLIWYFTGKKNIGMKVAIISGRLISVISIFSGIFILLKGSFYIAICLLIIGFFIFFSSSAQSQLVSIQKILYELNVSQACSRSYRVLEDNSSIRALAKYKSNTKNLNNEWVLLCREGRWVGYVSEKILHNISVQNWDRKFLYDYIRPLDELPSVGEKDPLWKAIIILEKTKKGRLLVFNIAGLPIGTLDRVDIGKIVLKKMGLILPDELIIMARKQNTYPLGLALPNIVNLMNTSDISDYQK